LTQKTVMHTSRFGETGGSMTDVNEDLWELGDVSLWIEQDSSIQLKAMTGQGDPVELSPDEARRVAHTLLAFAERADS
jgi:hypothetical protein